jgi:hypothetical protein
VQPPKPDYARLEIASRNFLTGIQACLKGKSMAPAAINMDLDVWRFIMHKKGMPSEHKGYTLYEKADFNRFETLPSDWYYMLNGYGEGTKIDWSSESSDTSSLLHRRGRLLRLSLIPFDQ